MRVRLRPGASVDDAISLLNELSVNAPAEARPVGASHPSDLRDHRFE
jgi:hypothetical protein